MLLKRYMDKGYTREEAAMGLAMVGEDTDDEDKVGRRVCRGTAVCDAGLLGLAVCYWGQ